MILTVFPSTVKEKIPTRLKIMSLLNQPMIYYLLKKKL